MSLPKSLAVVVLTLGFGLPATAQQQFPRPIVLYQPAGPQPPATRQPAGAQPPGRQPAGQQPATMHPAGPGFPGPQFAGPQFAGPQFAGPQFAGQPFAGPQKATPQPVKPQPAAPQPPRGPAMPTPGPFPATVGGFGQNRPVGKRATGPFAVPAGQVSQPDRTAGPGRSADSASQQPKTPAQEWAEQQSRPTLQALQNPSGGFQLTHSGFSTSQQMAPNLYFGRQFDTWTNQQPVAQMSASSGELSRFQPAPFGGYVAPNTYVGSRFDNWSNLSQGHVTPGTMGSWNISVWR